MSLFTITSLPVSWTVKTEFTSDVPYKTYFIHNRRIENPPNGLPAVIYYDDDGCFADGYYILDDGSHEEVIYCFGTDTWEERSSIPLPYARPSSLSSVMAY